MIKHIVAFRLKNELTEDEKSEARNEMKAKLEALPAKIAELNTVEVGLNFNPTDAAYDVVLTTTHDTKEDLNTYAAHPDHQEVVKYIVARISDRVVVDYEM